MTSNTSKALRAYLLLSGKEKMQFLNEITEIEKMPAMVKMDYTKSLLMRVGGQKENSSVCRTEPATS